MSASMSVVIPAAGEGQRLGRRPPKAAVMLSGKPLLAHAIRPFLTFDQLVELVIVEPADTSFRSHLEGHLSDMGRIQFVKGGTSRLASVRNGVNALREPGEIIMVHDAARPLLTPELIRRVYEQTSETGAAIPVLPIPDTVKRVHEQRVKETVDRDELYRAQTPQGMRRTYYEEGLRQLADDEDRAASLTDDADVVQVAGYEVRTVEGDWRNFKITYPDDLQRAERLMNGDEGRG